MQTRTASDRRTDCSKRAGIALALALVACSAPPEPGDAAAGDAWREFQGSLNATGTRHTIPMGGDRRASLIDMSGTLLLSGPSRPNVGFRSQVLVLNDSETGLVGRSVWTDQNGDQVFSELEGQNVAAGSRINGKLVGGTGRYQGASGTYEFAWQYVVEAEDGSVQGRTVGLKGRVRLAPSPSATGKP
ncbi:MAG: hypothetical protein U1F41_16345 [Burkholderiales bacterium]